MVVLCLTMLAYAQDHSKLDNVVQRVQQYYNAEQNDSMFNLFGPRIQQLLPMDKTIATMGQMHAQMGSFDSYKFSKSDEKFYYYDVSFAKMDLVLVVAPDSNYKLTSFRFMPKPAEKKEAEKGASDIQVAVAGGTIHGTLTLPDGAAKVPVVLLIAGSGPTDRDGNSSMGLTSNAYRLLADSLRDAGIACLRYDKRGVGESAAAARSEADMRFDDMADDAVAFIELLKKDARFSAVTVMGHSEGSLVGMIAARRAGAGKYISLAGGGEPIDNILKWQLSFQSDDVSIRAGHVMDSLKRGYLVKKVDADLQSIFRPSVQPFIQSWMKYDPAKELKKLKIPVLLIQGENDKQVTMDQVKILKESTPTATLVTFPDMNHVLKDAPHDRDQNYTTYKDGKRPLTPGLATAIISFIKK